MKYGIHSNKSRDIAYSVAINVAKILLAKGVVPVFDKQILSDEDSVYIKEVEGITFDDFDDCEVIISIGGDGTFLSTISKYRHLGVPFIGINKGSIGFLTEINEDSIEDAIDRCRDNDELGDEGAMIQSILRKRGFGQGELSQKEIANMHTFFKDIHTIVFIGFGMLFTLLKHHNCLT